MDRKAIWVTDWQKLTGKPASDKAKSIRIVASVGLKRRRDPRYRGVFDGVGKVKLLSQGVKKSSPFTVALICRMHIWYVETKVKTDNKREAIKHCQVCVSIRRAGGEEQEEVHSLRVGSEASWDGGRAAGTRARKGDSTRHAQGAVNIQSHWAEGLSKGHRLRPVTEHLSPRASADPTL